VRISRKVDVRITVPRKYDIGLFDDSTSIRLTPLRIEISGNKQVFDFPGLWRGSFRIIAFSNNEEYLFEIDHSGDVDISEDIKVSCNTIIGFSKNIRRPGRYRTRYIRFLNNLGWKLTFKSIDELTAVCGYLSDVSREEVGRAAIVIPTPVELNSHQPKDMGLKHPSVCLIQNHQIKQKSDALYEFTKVIKELPEVTFYISKGLPENQNNKNYKRVIRALSKLENVILPDINHHNKYDYLKSCDIYVLASGLDCTPATIIEASLVGKPVLASRVGGVPEMIIEGETGWTIENGDTKTWIRHIRTLISDPALDKKMGLKAQKIAHERYSLTRISKRIYKEFL
jgi:glycosyltransferase involved in cell wall biosynthesis